MRAINGAARVRWRSNAERWRVLVKELAVSNDELNTTRVFAAGDWGSVAKPVMAQERVHCLVAVEGVYAGQRFAVGPAPLRLGRASTCGLVFADAQVSGQHCDIIVSADRPDALVTDLRSTNGTFIDGVRLQGAASLPNGAVLQIGSQVLRHEWMLKSDFDQGQELARDLDKARHYVQSLLPQPITLGAIRTDWVFEPSTQLGGDAFGYHQLNANLFAVYLVDVSGHGVGSAMHGVSVMNVLRQRALPDTDFSNPSQVLASLNTMFQMEQHDGMYFSAWYGVYDSASRSLRYASGGHHPSFLISSDSSVLPLKTRNLVIGAMPDMAYVDAAAAVAPGSRLYIFSDGVFEVTTREGTQWDLDDFLPLLVEQGEGGVTESQRLYSRVKQVARPGPLEDDFSMLVVTFL